MEGNIKKHSAIGKSKNQILEYILRQETPVNEAKISEHLKAEHSELSRATVTRHLSDLADVGCITRVKPIEKSRLNYWDIDFKNLKNIKKLYPSIELKTLPKTLEILKEALDREGYINSSDTMECRRLEIQIQLSDAYFTYLLNTDVKTFRERIIILNQFAKDYLKTKHYETLLDEIYKEFIESISIDYEIGLSKEEFEECLTYLIYYDKSDISTTIHFNAAIHQELSDKWHKKAFEDLERAAFEQIDFVEIDERIRLEVNRHTSKNSAKLNQSLKEIEMIKTKSTEYIPDIVFKHFYDCDILNGKATREEMKFVFFTKNIMQKYGKEGDKKVMEELDRYYIRFLAELNKK
jgi:predicted transcriptional regulator